MAEVLTQKQIDELLGNLQKNKPEETSQDSVQPVANPLAEKKQVQYKEYDFLTPKRINRDQIKLLDSVFENFARLFALQMSSLLRLSCEAELISLDEYHYSEFSNALSDSVLIGSFELYKEKNEHTDKLLLFEVARPLAYAIIDRMLGGSGTTYPVEKEHTEIELALMESVFQKSSQIFINSWSNYFDLKVSYNNIETNSRLIQSVSPDETIALAVIEFTMKNLKEKVNICIPLDTIKEVFKAFDAKFAKVRRSDDEQSKMTREYIIDSLNESDLTVSALLGQTKIELRDILNLRPGDIIPLSTSTSGNSIQVNVDDIAWFKGVMGVKKKKYAVRVGKILDTKNKNGR
ncbi:MAG: FliM/FliN family flagellar motor switch protein [Oscillospiraceae bacterium]